jgi:ABC-2 type transport system permease protein
METTLDLSRWRETPHGVNYRRWTIVATNVRHLLRTRFFRILVTIAWLGSLAIAAAGFLFSQSVSSGGLLESLATRIGPRQEALVAALGGFVTLFPDIVVRGIFTLIFWLHSYIGLSLSLIALTTLVPQLITTDRASNALTIYLSRPLTSADYLIGKLGTIAGVLLLVWTGPLVFGWVLSMAFAPNRDFVIYSFVPLLRALAFNGVALVSLSAIALGVSAIGRNSRTTVVAWIMLWLVLSIPASAPRAPGWLRHASFYQDLTTVRLKVFSLSDALADAATQLPMLNDRFVKNLTAASVKAEPIDYQGALWALAAFCALSSVVFLRRIRPE